MLVVFLVLGLCKKQWNDFFFLLVDGDCDKFFIWWLHIFRVRRLSVCNLGFSVISWLLYLPESLGLIILDRVTFLSLDQGFLLLKWAV